MEPEEPRSAIALHIVRRRTLKLLEAVAAGVQIVTCRAQACPEHRHLVDE
jgi:hypothetical protein